MRYIKIFVFSFVILFVAGAFIFIAQASHSWNGYHWARTANPFNLKLGDNVSLAWDSYLAASSVDWSQSSVLDTSVVLGQSKGNCKPTNGRVEVCNKTYGNNGWLGVASIWVSGSHITKSSVKVNDTYFNISPYNAPEWKQFVMCQEIGHTLGLDHQDEDFSNANLNTCMDYTNSPASNQRPNQHDYDQLAITYGHLDAITTVYNKIFSSAPANNDDIDTTNPKEWGKETRKSKDGKGSLYERDLGKGKKVFTFVIWANEK